MSAQTHRTTDTMPLLVMLAGPTGSGKTTARRFLEEKYQAFGARFSDTLRAKLRAEGVEETKANLQERSTKERERHGDTYLARLMYDHLHEHDMAEEFMVVEGIRMPHDVEMLRTFARETSRVFIPIYIDAPSNVRFTRRDLQLHMTGQNRPSWEEFEESERNECEARLDAVRSMCDVVIENKWILPEEGFLKRIDDEIRPSL